MGCTVQGMDNKKTSKVTRSNAVVKNAITICAVWKIIPRRNVKFALIDTVPMQRRNLPEKKHSFHIWQVFAYLTFSLLNRFLLEVRSQGYSPLGWRALFASSFFGCAGFKAARRWSRLPARSVPNGRHRRPAPRALPAFLKKLDQKLLRFLFFPLVCDLLGFQLSELLI